MGETAVVVVVEVVVVEDVVEDVVVDVVVDVLVETTALVVVGTDVTVLVVVVPQPTTAEAITSRAVKTSKTDHCGFLTCIDSPSAYTSVAEARCLEYRCRRLLSRARRDRGTCYLAVRSPLQKFRNILDSEGGDKEESR